MYIFGDFLLYHLRIFFCEWGKVSLLIYLFTITLKWPFFQFGHIVFVSSSRMLPISSILVLRREQLLKFLSSRLSATFLKIMTVAEIDVPRDQS